MKYLIRVFILTLPILISFTAEGQNESRYGISFGTSTTPIDDNSFDALTPSDSLRFNFINNPSPFSYGVFIRPHVKNFFFKGGITFGRMKLNYDVLDQNNERTILETRTDNKMVIDLPLSIGYKLDVVIINFGITGTTMVDPLQQSYLDLKTYTSALGNLSWSYTGGIGLDVGETLTVSANVAYRNNAVSREFIIYDKFRNNFNLQQLRIYFTAEVPLNRFDK